VRYSRSKAKGERSERLIKIWCKVENSLGLYHKFSLSLPGVVVKQAENFTFNALYEWITWLNNVFITTMIYMYFLGWLQTWSPRLSSGMSGIIYDSCYIGKGDGVISCSSSALNNFEGQCLHIQIYKMYILFSSCVSNIACYFYFFPIIYFIFFIEAHVSFLLFLLNAFACKYFVFLCKCALSHVRLPCLWVSHSNVSFYVRSVKFLILESEIFPPPFSLTRTEIPAALNNVGAFTLLLCLLFVNIFSSV
jgi:hypothetical protein